MSKSVALFGGSFNPPHAGHREIVRRILRRKGIDEVWIFPVWRHPFGKKMSPFTERIHNCRRFFAGLGKRVKVKDLERRLGGVSYTIRLIRHLKKKYPALRFSLVIGGDAYRDRKAWKDFEAIREEVPLIVFQRGPRSPIPDVSSTEIRRRSGAVTR